MKIINSAIFILAAGFIAPSPVLAQEETSAASAENAQAAVACLGKISAGDSISRLAAPNAMGGAPIIEKIFVKKGESVVKDQQIAVLKGWEKAHAAFENAKAACDVAKSQAAIEVARALNEIDELSGAYQQNIEVLEQDPPRSEREKIKYEQKAILRKLAQAKSMIELIKVNTANSVKRAEAAVVEAEAVAGEFLLKAPFTGEVIEVNAKSGEAVGEAGVCEIADTSVMYVDAEVYVSDISKIKAGDRAVCEPEGLPDETLDGEVCEISPYVKNNLVFSQDPGEYSDRKVILVKIRLEKSAKVRALIGSLVRVKILTNQQQ